MLAILLATSLAAVPDAEFSSAKWDFRRDPGTFGPVRLSASVTLLTPATLNDFFGSSWNVWPDTTWADGGFDAGVVVRESKDGGYRVQLSHKYQAVALVRYPAGGVVRVADLAVSLKTPMKVEVTAVANHVRVSIDGVEKISYVDPLPTLPAGKVGVGVANGAKAAWKSIGVAAIDDKPRRAVVAHQVGFAVRKWLGGRDWVFDGGEPVLMLPTPDNPVVNSAKLRPGVRPLLSWNAQWDIANQGAFAEGKSVQLPAKVVAAAGPGVRVSWGQKHAGSRFETRTALSASHDAKRNAYAYDVESDLTVLPGADFTFRYGYDFEHHTPLDPFRWQYLVAKSNKGLYHRPVYPIDPGTQLDLATADGLRVWHGRHSDDIEVSPAVEYRIKDAGGRKLNTAVCAAFYDTGVAFPQETAKAGTKVRVAYRYTGYPKEEAARLFEASKVYDSPTLDPNHHYLFADTWPAVAMNDAVPLSKTWIYGRRPFLSGHNVRPTYDYSPADKAMRLGPASKAYVTVASPPDLAPGKYAVIAEAKDDHSHGPGVSVELTVHAPKTGKELSRVTGYPARSADWAKSSLAFDVPEKGATITLALANAGTGAMLVRSVAFVKTGDTDALPAAMTKAAAKPDPAPAGAIADYRMTERRGLHVLDNASGPFGLLELGNVAWTRDSGRDALVFRDDGPAGFPRAGRLDLSHFSHPAYADRKRVAVAVAGYNGGHVGDLVGVTLAAWVKPDAKVGKGSHTTSGDIVGFGARRFVLRLRGESAPYRLEGALNVNDLVATKEAVVKSGTWQHVAMTAGPEGRAWRVRLYLDGKEVASGLTTKFALPKETPPSLVLGTEIYYFHDSHYRGLIGRTLVFGRALSAAEVAALAK